MFGARKWTRIGNKKPPCTKASPPTTAPDDNFTSSSNHCVARLRLQAGAFLPTTSAETTTEFHYERKAAWPAGQGSLQSHITLVTQQSLHAGALLFCSLRLAERVTEREADKAKVHKMQGYGHTCSARLG